MKLLFVKGKKGLAANHNGKFYFPDRNGCIKATGLYDCKITIDKDKFAFVDGKPIKTQAASIEIICSLLNLDMSSVGLENRETINVFNVNNVDVLFVKNSIATHLMYINDKKQIESITSFSTNPKSSYNVRQLYSPEENMKRIISNMDIKNYLVKNGAETLSDLMLLKAATIVKSKQGKYHHIIDMSLVDSKFIVVHTEYWDVNLTGIYVYDKKQNALIDVDEKIFDAVADKKNCKKISIKNIDEFCIKNHIAMHYMRDEQEDSELKPVFENKIRFMNTNIVVKCLDANALFVDIREEDKAVITKSFDELEAYKKKIGKCISKSMLQEFSKFSPKNILGL